MFPAHYAHGHGIRLEATKFNPRRLVVGHPGPSSTEQQVSRLLRLQLLFL
jgi:hypothetical protein